MMTLNIEYYMIRAKRYSEMMKRMEYDMIL